MATPEEQAIDRLEIDMSLLEQVEALDADEDGLSGFVKWLGTNSVVRARHAVYAYLEQYPTREKWIAREAEKIRGEEAVDPDDWEDRR
jgi:hypothetical protein